MKRLTVHLNNTKTRNEKRMVKGAPTDKQIRRNTVTYQVSDEDEAKKVISDINEYQNPRNNVKKWYLSNII
jgi:hypothetical protein|tara:strand:- start:1226 stop:1438 length:213 start_codon:yes stop_codon:yes gene_type:complete